MGLEPLALWDLSPESCQFTTEKIYHKKLKPKVSYTRRIYHDRATLYNCEFSTIPQPTSGSHSKFPECQCSSPIRDRNLMSILLLMGTYQNAELAEISVNRPCGTQCNQRSKLQNCGSFHNSSVKNSASSN